MTSADGVANVNANILPNEIKDVEPAPKIFNVCGSNEVFRLCGPDCTTTCDSLNGIPNNSPCTGRCVIGCVCRNGYVRNNGQCIRPEQCPNYIPLQCAANEYSSICANRCSETCILNLTLCLAPCFRGCFCSPGYVRIGNNCVPRNQCCKYNLYLYESIQFT